MSEQYDERKFKRIEQNAKAHVHGAYAFDDVVWLCSLVRGSMETSAASLEAIEKLHHALAKQTAVNAELARQLNEERVFRNGFGDERPTKLDVRRWLRKVLS